MKNPIFPLQKQLLDPLLFFLHSFLSHLRMIPFIFSEICSLPFLAPFPSLLQPPLPLPCQQSSFPPLSFLFAPHPPTHLSPPPTLDPSRSSAAPRSPFSSKSATKPTPSPSTASSRLTCPRTPCPHYLCLVVGLMITPLANPFS